MNGIFVNTTSTSQNYEIVENEPEIKKVGEMVYINSVSEPIVASFDATVEDGEFYGVPNDFFSRIDEETGTFTNEDLKELKYLIQNSTSNGNRQWFGYIYVGQIPELATYTGELVLEYKLSNDEFPYIETLYRGYNSQNEDWWGSEIGYLIKMSDLGGDLDNTWRIFNLYELSSDVKTFQIISIAYPDGTKIYENNDNSNFNINNLKISNGENFNPIKELINADTADKSYVDESIQNSEISTKSYVDNAISNSITTALNTPV